MKKVFVYVLDTLADWEIGYVNAEIRTGRFFKKGQAPLEIVTLSNTSAPIKTMGGLHVLPDLTVDECNLDDAAALILPGGDTWMNPVHDPILSLAQRCLDHNVLVAAICGGTFGLARAGLLNNRAHTSNDLGYLKAICLDYSGEAHYKDEPCVTDANLITANGIAPVAFAADVLKYLDVFSPEVLDCWKRLYTTCDGYCYLELMRLMG